MRAWHVVAIVFVCALAVVALTIWIDWPYLR